MDKSCREVKGEGLGKGCVSLELALGMESLWEMTKEPVISHDSGIYSEETLLVTADSETTDDIYYFLGEKKLTYTNGDLTPGAVLYKQGEGIEITGKRKVTSK